MTMFVGLAMAEIVSALPSSGGPYFWASVLGGRKWGPFAAFVTGIHAAASHASTLGLHGVQTAKL